MIKHGKVHKHGQMVPNILVIGETEKLKDMVHSHMQIMMYMLVNLKKIVQMVKVYILMQVDKHTMVCGLMIYNMVMVSNNLKMDPNIQVNLN